MRVVNHLDLTGCRGHRDGVDVHVGPLLARRRRNYDHRPGRADLTKAQFLTLTRHSHLLEAGVQIHDSGSLEARKNTA